MLREIFARLADQTVHSRKTRLSGTMLRILIRVFPAQLHYREQYARLAASHGDWATAYSRWDEIARDYPAHMPARLQKGKFLFNMGLYEQAEKEITEATTQWPDQLRNLSRNPLSSWRRFFGSPLNSIDDHLECANVLIKLGDYSDAEKVLEEAIKKWPNDHRPLSDCAIVALYSRNLDIAHNRIAHVLEQYPGLDHLRIEFGNVLEKTGDKNQALELLRKTLENWPKENAYGEDWSRAHEHDYIWGAPDKAFTVEFKPSFTDIPITLRTRTSDVNVFEEIFTENQYRISLLRNPRLILDAGANIGLSTIFFARRYPGAKIIAIEPEPENFKLLETNTRHYPNVVPVKAALWGTSKRLTLQNPDRTSWAFQTTDCEAGSTAQGSERKTTRGICVQDLMRDHDFSHVDLFKIDIEGAERDLFDGPVPWVDCVDVFMIELHDRFKNGCTKQFNQATEDFDFRFRSGDTTVAARRGMIMHHMP